MLTPTAPAPASNNLIAGNLIGTDVTGTKSLGNRYGIQVVDGSSNTIGGTTAGARNIISGNGYMNFAGAGVLITSDGTSPSRATRSRATSSAPTRRNQSTRQQGKRHQHPGWCVGQHGRRIGDRQYHRFQHPGGRAGRQHGGRHRGQRCDPEQLDRGELRSGDRPRPRRSAPPIRPVGRMRAPTTCRTSPSSCRRHSPSAHGGNGDAQQRPRNDLHHPVVRQRQRRSLRFRPGPDLPGPDDRDHGPDQRATALQRHRGRRPATSRSSPRRPPTRMATRRSSRPTSRPSGRRPPPRRSRLRP